MSSKDLTIPVDLTWTSLEVGQWKPVKFGNLEIIVTIDVPVKSEYIHNFNEVAGNLIATERKPITPKFTLAGMRYIYEQAQQALESDKSESGTSGNISNFETLE